MWAELYHTWLDSSSSKDSSLAIGASSVDLNSHDSVVHTSEPLESSLLLDFHPSSEYCKKHNQILGHFNPSSQLAAIKPQYIFSNIFWL